MKREKERKTATRLLKEQYYRKKKIHYKVLSHSVKIKTKNKVIGCIY